MELSTYFRINAEKTGQFERTLIIADKGSYVSYLEGCTAPMRDENQLHAAVVELVALDDAEIKYSTVQNWYPGDPETGKGGIYNFVTKRGDCRGDRSKVSLDPGRDRLGDHLEVPVLHPARRGQLGRVLFDRHHQRPPAGRHRHQDDPPGARTPARGSSPRASARASRQYLSRPGLGASKAKGARNFTQCDSLLIGKHCGAHTVPYIEARNGQPEVRARGDDDATLRRPAVLRHAARALRGRGRGADLVNGFVRDVLQQLPMEFAVEAQKLVAISLEGSVG
jgi:Fe-S cluster assembly protein SufB